MGTDKVGFAEVVRGGATGSDVSHVTGSGPDRKRPCSEVLVCAGATGSCATISSVFVLL